METKSLKLFLPDNASPCSICTFQALPHNLQKVAKWKNRTLQKKELKISQNFVYVLIDYVSDFHKVLYFVCFGVLVTVVL